MSLNPVKNSYQDIILQEPELVMTTFTQDQIDLLKNPRYLSLVKIIHERGPVTLTELSEMYTELAKSSVHRYLTTLREHNIVQEAGQRIIEGQFQSQTLYSLNARYIIIDEPEINWEGSEGKRIFQELVKILKILYPNKTIEEEALYQWQLQFQRIVDANKQQMITSKDPEILEILSVWAPWTINSIIEDMGFASILLTEPKAQQTFLNCFKTLTEEEISSDISHVELSMEITNVTYKDVIQQFPEIRNVILPNDPRSQYFEKPAYLPLIHVLRDGPITIEDLVEQYNQIANVPKTRSTIYRYIKTLKRANLVIEVGKRVTQGKKAVQTLYGPKARWFANYDTASSKWESDKGRRRDAIIKMLQFLYPKLPKVNKKCFHEYLLSMWEYVIDAHSQLSSKGNQKMIELLHTYDWNDFYVTYTTFLDFYAFINMPNMYERLIKCFS
ncbi:MAG: helix-turn-helix domain-containing protein [Candidatus Heimdallarchaeota archaeon]